jgi:hypothetical protein
MDAIEEQSVNQTINPSTAGAVAVSGILTAADHCDHIQARWAIRRKSHRVQPGLYALGNPNPTTPVFVSANYTLSFDALRAALNGMDAYLLVLDTQGVNVWCAAGEGMFGTDELVKRIETVGLQQVVSHRRLILPQLGAPGVDAQEVKKRSGFTVEYGPVRAEDLPEYLCSGHATDEMRQVRFTLRDRLPLIPVELVHALPLIILTAILQFWPGAAALLAGAVLFPILLPWLPSHDFSFKGWILGVLVMLPFVVNNLASAPLNPVTLGWALVILLTMPVVTSYLALNFTGATTFTSRTGVRKEIYRYIPAMGWSLGIGLVLTIALVIIRIGGWHV